MPYNINVPLANQRLSASQPLLLQNTIAIDTVERVDHIPFDDASGYEGMHAKVSLPPVAAEPVMGAGLLGMYNFLNASTALQEICIRRAGAVTSTPITAHRAYTAADPAHVAVLAINWFYLPCGYLVKFGQAVASGPAVVINMNLGLNATEQYNAIPYVYYCLSAQPTPNIHLIMTALAASQFSLYCDQPNKPVFWFSIGTVA